MEIKILYSIGKDTENYLNRVYSFKHLKHGRENIREALLAQIDPVLKEKVKNVRGKKDARLEIFKHLKKWREVKADTVSKKTPKP